MPKLSSALLHPAAKPIVFILALLPFAWLVYGAIADKLGANPAEHLERSTGSWALRFLCITLAVTPVRTIANLPALLRLRRMLGLFAFFYATLHFLTYVVLDQTLDLSYVGEDIAKRPYITVGFTAWLLLIPLAATSTKGWIRRLGKRWTRLHRLVYLVAVLGTIHFYWQVKKDVREPLIFAGILAVLLGFRLIPRRSARKRPMDVTS